MEAARGRAAELVGRRPAPPRDVLQTARDVVGEADAILSRPAWKAMRAAMGPGAPDPERLAASLVGPAPDPVVALFLGRTFLARGRADEAARWLDVAEHSHDLPPWLLGGCRLAQGQAADLQGQRARAQAFYRKAADAPAFPGRDAAYFFSTVPFAAGP